MKSTLESNPEPYSGGVTGSDDFVTSRCGHFERLLDHDVFSRFCCRDRWVQVSTAWSANGNHTDTRVGQHGFDRIERIALVLSREFTRSIRSAACDTNERRPNRVTNGPRVKVSNHAASNDSYSDCHVVVSIWLGKRLKWAALIACKEWSGNRFLIRLTGLSIN
jgi:hypothetical protein